MTHEGSPPATEPADSVVLNSTTKDAAMAMQLPELKIPICLSNSAGSILLQGFRCLEILFG